MLKFSVMRNSILFWRLTFLVALISTLGSLYFSEVMGFPPCTLCWYQRICMYPLVVILGAALWSEDAQPARYVLPLALLGLGVAIYHNLVYFHVIPEEISPCRAGVSCSTRFVQWFGFADIPMLSLIGFALVNVFGFLGFKKGSLS